MEKIAALVLFLIAFHAHAVLVDPPYMRRDDPLCTLGAIKYANFRLAADEVAPGNVAFTITSFNNICMSKAEFYIETRPGNMSLFSVKTGSARTFSSRAYETVTLSDGMHQVYAVVYDGENNSVRVGPTFIGVIHVKQEGRIHIPNE